MHPLTRIDNPPLEYLHTDNDTQEGDCTDRYTSTAKEIILPVSINCVLIFLDGRHVVYISRPASMNRVRSQNMGEDMGVINLGSGW